MAEGLLVAQDGGVLRLTLNRPDRLNSLDIPLHAALLDALRTADADPTVRAVLLGGAGRGFCAGQDLTEVGEAPDLAETLELRFNPLVRALRTLGKPVVCAVQGVAAGAGANIALACDIVLAAQNARFIQAFVKIGLIPDAGGSWVLPRLVGDAPARAMAMLGEPVSATQAENWGLIWRVVPDDALAAEAAKVVETLTALPTQAIRLMKQAFLAAGTNTLDRQLDLERDLQGEAGRTPDFAEGMRAFLDKRQPRFTGRPA